MTIESFEDKACDIVTDVTIRLPILVALPVGMVGFSTAATAVTVVRSVVWIKNKF